MIFKRKDEFFYVALQEKQAIGPYGIELLSFRNAKIYQRIELKE